MASLIDADAYLKKVCTYKETGCGNCKFQTVCPADMPTVEAITVEWLRTWFLNNVINHGELFDLLITDWEKENGKAN